MLFRMVPKLYWMDWRLMKSFRAVLFRMVPKLETILRALDECFRAVLFRMVPKRKMIDGVFVKGFRAVLFRMVPKKATHFLSSFLTIPSLTHSSFPYSKGKRLVQ